MPPISIINLQSGPVSSVYTTPGSALPKTKEMEYKTSKLSKEKLLLAFIIGIGCYGFYLNFNQKNQSYRTTQKLINQYVEGNLARTSRTGPLKMEGTFMAGEPIRFTLISRELRKKNVEIDFGNGIQQTLSASVFTYAYRDKGQFELKIKQKGKVLFQTSLYITDHDQLVMN